MKCFFVLGCISVLFLPIDAYSDTAIDAQYNVQYFDDDSIKMKSLGSLTPNIIINNSRNTLHFHYRTGRQQWEENIIPAGDQKNLPCNDDTAAEIWVNTGNKHVQYALPCRKRYVLYWNPDKGLWDVAQLRD